MKKTTAILFFYFVNICFLVFALFLAIKKPDFFPLISAIPIGGIILAALFFNLDKLLLLVTFLTPLAVNLKDYELSLGISLPTEPLMFGILVFYLIKLVFERNYDKRIIRHPVSIAVLFYLLWMAVTTISSEDPIVSIKFLIAKLWFIVCFYFIIIFLFKKEKSIKTFVWLYMIPLAGVIIWTTFRHSLIFFDRLEGNLISQPFYKDHTIYGAAIAIYVPYAIALVFLRKQSFSWRLFAIAIASVLLIGLFFSYSRAAWLGVIGALGLFLVIKLKINYKIVLFFGTIVLGGFIYMQSRIITDLRTNKQDSSERLLEHVQSMSNISSDASNVERLNRWQCALRMFNERPFLGWGPGTYQFYYGPFQRSYEKTIISTNSGDMGNAHSEYLGPLSESGILGMFSVLLIIGTVIWTALTTLKRIEKNKELSAILLGAFLGLITYFIHGVLNNFLDTDKLSVPYWGFIAIVVAIDVFYSRTLENKKPEQKTDPV